MANTILTPGEESVTPMPVEQSTPYLEKDKYLSEFQTEGEKAVVRENLDIYAKNSVYNKTESDTILNEKLKAAFDKYLNMEDPHGILPIVKDMFEGVVRNDGSTPFILPQKGVDPVQDYHLVTKRFVTQLLKEHLDIEDPHQILPEVQNILEQYVKQSQVYFRDQLYTKNEIDQQGNQYIKINGTTSFTKPQIGIDPQIDSHLSTKRYVDQSIYKHLIDVDPHGFISILNNRLASYVKASNVYDKTQTYSRTQIDSVIRSLVYDAAKEAIQEHTNIDDPHNILTQVQKLKYIKQDGSTPFKNPQKGVDAIDPQDLVTLQQVQNEVNSKKVTWLTSGPVETTVGFVEDNSQLPEELTIQEIFDAIFYGKSVSITVPEYVTMGESGKLTLCVHGSIATIAIGELYQGNKLIYTFTKEDFEEGCVEVDSEIITGDTDFTFRITYINGTSIEDKESIKCSMPIFVGTLPKWKFGNTVTMDYLKELVAEDPNNNKFVQGLPSYISINYNFTDPKLKHLMVVVPYSYPKLKDINTQVQKFGLEAFDIINMIPFQIEGAKEDIIYTIYIYRQALSRLDQEVTFNFEQNE